MERYKFAGDGGNYIQKNEFFAEIAGVLNHEILNDRHVLDALDSSKILIIFKESNKLFAYGDKPKDIKAILINSLKKTKFLENFIHKFDSEIQQSLMKIVEFSKNILFQKIVQKVTFNNFSPDLACLPYTYINESLINKDFIDSQSIWINNSGLSKIESKFEFNEEKS